MGSTEHLGGGFPEQKVDLYYHYFTIYQRVVGRNVVSHSQTEVREDAIVYMSARLMWLTARPFLYEFQSGEDRDEEITKIISSQNRARSGDWEGVRDYLRSELRAFMEMTQEEEDDSYEASAESFANIIRSI